MYIRKIFSYTIQKGKIKICFFHVLIFEAPIFDAVSWSVSKYSYDENHCFEAPFFEAKSELKAF